MRDRRRGRLERRCLRDGRGPHHRSRPEHGSSDARHPAGHRSRGVDGSTLASISSGASAIVVGYLGGEGMRRKAMDLGLVPGATVEVLVRGAGQLLVVRVGETRIMVGHGVARHIRVLDKE